MSTKQDPSTSVRVEAEATTIALEVVFDSISVARISDPGVNAEVVFTFDVNGRRTTFTDDNLGLGTTSLRRRLTVGVGPLGRLVVRVSGIERDVTSADDALPGFTRTFNAATNFGQGTHQVTVENAHMRYTMRFTVRRSDVPPPLPTTLAGTATLTTTNDRARGPFSAPVTIGLEFTGNRTGVRVTSFPPVTVQTDDGEVVVSLLDADPGTFTRSTGAMTLPVTLHFQLPVVADSDLPITLTTGAAGGLAGSPLDQDTGEVTLVGAGPFDGGFLGDGSATVRVVGTVEDLP